MSPRIPVILLLMTSLVSTGSAEPVRKKSIIEWEMGATAAALDIPLYPGSSDSKDYLLPLPYATLRSEILEIDDGIRAKLFRAKEVRLNLSGDFGVPVSSKDSAIRTGMPDLDTVLQIGPSLEVTLSGARNKPYHFRFEMPVRLAFATDFEQVNNLGWISEPRLTYETRRPFKKGFAWQITAGLRYANRDYHAYYYDVPAAFATPTRREFRSKGGYSGLFSDLIGNWRHGDLIYWALIRYQKLDKTEFELSPLVEDKNYNMFGIGITWIFASSL